MLTLEIAVGVMDDLAKDGIKDLLKLGWSAAVQYFLTH